MRVLICGSRNWDDPKPIRLVISSLPKDTIVIEGGARGADTIAANLAREYGLVVEEYRAEWSKHPRAAGPIRNRRMLTEGKPEVVYAFYVNKASSRGTANMVMQAKNAGLIVYETEKKL